MPKGKYERWREPEGLILLEGWARDGLTDEQIAHNIGINTATLYRWKDKFCEISKALKNGKEVADYIVENALYRNAIGYERTETVIDEMGEEHYIKKWYPPNTTAQIFWLKNRRPDKWKDKRDDTAKEEKSGGGLIMIPERTDEEGG